MSISGIQVLDISHEVFACREGRGTVTRPGRSGWGRFHFPAITLSKASTTAFEKASSLTCAGIL